MCHIVIECRRQCAQGFSQSMNLIEILKSDLSKYEWKTKKGYNALTTFCNKNISPISLDRSHFVCYVHFTFMRAEG